MSKLNKKMRRKKKNNPKTLKNKIKNHNLMILNTTLKLKKLKLMKHKKLKEIKSFLNKFKKSMTMSIEAQTVYITQTKV